MPEAGPSSTPGGGRRPGRARRRVVAPPTGAPGEEVEVPSADGPAPRDEGPEDARRWAAEAERLLADRPPHWG